MEDIIFPADHVEYIEKDWQQLPIFPDGTTASNYNGLSFSIFMPLEVNGAIKNYMFSFKIIDVEVTQE